MDKNFHQKCNLIKFEFSVYTAQLTGKPCITFERVKPLGLETSGLLGKGNNGKFIRPELSAKINT